MRTRLTLLTLAIALPGCAQLPLATPAASTLARAQDDPGLDALDRQFNAMRPLAKAAFLQHMAASLVPRWNAYQAAHQQAYSDAHPPVAPLTAASEQALRAALAAYAPGLVTKTNLKAAVDCDGIGPAYGDKYSDFQTSVAVKGVSLDADEVLYHVTPVGHPELNGALAIHFYGARMVPSVFGDAGPAWGEACHLVIQTLGLPSSPINGGDEHHHDMLLLSGLGKAFMATGQLPTPANLYPFLRAQGVPGFGAPAALVAPTL